MIVKKLLTLLGSDGTLLTFSGEKKCGGFHADYALTWKVAGVEYAALFCFGCGEVKLFGPQQEFRYDIGEEDSLTRILKHYVRNRPKPSNSAAYKEG
jgi:hypothetical protein